MYKIFTLMCGIPGSGKTSVIRSLVEDRNYISSDEIRRVINGSEECQDNASLVWSIFYGRVLRALKSRETQDNFFVLDATFCKKSDRVRIAEYIREHAVDGDEVSVVIHVLNTSLEDAKLRNSMRERVVPEHVLERMHASLMKNYPSTSEGFDIVSEIESEADGFSKSGYCYKLIAKVQ